MQTSDVNYPVFNFDRFAINNYLLTFNNANQCIEYLNFVLKEWSAASAGSFEVNPEKITFSDYIKSLIKYYKKIPSNLSAQPSADKKLNWLGSKADLIYLIDQLISIGKLGYIKNIDQVISANFTILGAEISPEKNRYVRAGLKKGLQQPSDEIKSII